MKVFISWSGERSHAVAKALHEELACLMNEIEPFISSEDIEKGTAWFPHISNELAGSDFGIICLTPENIESRWVHFEAGALACKFSNKKVAPLLIELEESQLRPPLSQLNFTRFKKDDVLKLMSAINGNLKKPLGDDNIKKSFDRWWSPFETKVAEALKQVRLLSAMEPKRRDDREILEEVLSLVRSVAMPNPWISPGMSGLAAALGVTQNPVDSMMRYAEICRNSDAVAPDYIKRQNSLDVGMNQIPEAK